MIGEKYTESHPIIMDFNSSLIEIYALLAKEEKKRLIMPISEKNIEIATAHYGDNSIYNLRHYLAISSNCILN